MAIKGGDPILEKQNWSTWFFGLCAVMFFCYGAAIYQEFVSRRTYIVYQGRFRTFEHDKTTREFDAFKTKWAADEEKAAKNGQSRADLQKKVDEANAKLGSGEYKKLKDERWTVFLQVGYNKSERAKSKSELDARFYTWKNALHVGGDAAQKAPEKAYHDQEKVVDEWSQKLAEAQARLDALDAQLKGYDGAVLEAQRQLDAHVEPYQKYVEKLDKIDHRSVRTIDQIVNDRLGVGGAYTFGTVDRCRTCHVAIDKPGFDQALFDKLDEKDPSKRYKKVFSTHPHIDPLFTKHPVDTYGCTVCHQGTGRATRIVTPLGANPDDYALKEDHDQAHGYTRHGGEDFPLYKGDFVQSSCQRCHNVQRWLDGAPVYEKGKDLFVTKGCHGCHAVKGYTDLPRVAPELLRIKGKVTPEWLVQWITNPKAFYPETRMPAFVFNPVAPGQKDPANNVKASMDPASYAGTAPDPVWGGVAPENVQRDTVVKIAAYLWQSSEEDPAMPFGKYPGGGSIAEGKQVLQTVGCIGCHNDGEKGNHRAPPLYKAGAKMSSPDWIWNWIRQPRWHAGTTTMPNLRLSDAEARDVTAYLWDLGKNERPKEDPELRKQLADPALAKEGGNLIAGWGCGGCHLIKGHEKDGRIAPELTLFAEKKPQELAFGDATNVPVTWQDWTVGKLHNPRQYVDIRSQARMPWFNLADDEVHALTVYLQGQKDPRVAQEMKKQFTGRNAKIERGRALVNYYNCVGCHTIEGRGGEILKINKDRALQPPNLNAEGVKIQADYLRDFLRNPTPIRWWLKIRMPTFPLSDEERADVIQYFRSVEGIDEPYDEPVSVATLSPDKIRRGDELKTKDNCLQCHMFHGAKSGGVTEENGAPDLANVYRRYRPDGIRVWLENPQKAMPGTKMPGFFYDFDSDTGKLEPLSPDAPDQIESIKQWLFSLTPGRSTAMNEAAPAAPKHR